MKSDWKGFQENYRQITPPSGGALFGSNKTKISLVTGKLNFTCPICFIDFLKPAAWAKRTANHYCSRACAWEGLRIHVMKPCIVCGEIMDLNPSKARAISTCSKKCLRLNRLKRTESLRSCIEYMDAVDELLKAGKRCVCGNDIGPFFVRGLKTFRGENELPMVDKSEARVLCRECNFSALAREAVSSEGARKYHASRGRK